MPRKLLILAALFFFSSASQASSIPKRSKLEEFLTSFTDSFDREKRYLLAEHFPNIFPIHFLCQFEDTNKKSFTVVPGDWLDVAEDGVLRCPGLLEASIEKQTRVRVSKYGALPMLFLEKGRLEIRAGSSPFFLETSTFQMGAVGTGRAQHLNIISNEKSQSIVCYRGTFMASLKVVPAPPLKQYLASHSCRMEFHLDGNDEVVYLYSLDIVEAANFSLIRRHWPPVRDADSKKLIVNPQILVGMILEVKPESAASKGLMAKWTLPLGLLKEPSCVLYAQSDQGKPAKEVARFEPKNLLQGELKIDPSFRSSYFSYICEDQESTVASNSLYQ